MTQLETNPGAVAEFDELTKPQKLAALLIMLGPESATQILQHLEDHELEAVTSEMTKFTMISQELQFEILREFTQVAIEASTSVRGGIDYTRGVLEKAIGQLKASKLINRVMPRIEVLSPIQQLGEIEPRQLVQLIALEQPQTVALILSHLSADRAAQILFLLPPGMREKVVERLATLAPTPLEVVEKVGEVLMNKLGKLQGQLTASARSHAIA